VLYSTQSVVRSKPWRGEVPKTESRERDDASRS